MTVFENNFETVPYVFCFFLVNIELFENLQVSFKLQRSFNYYLIRAYIPTSCLVVMSWATFWLPITTYPARITLIVTNFLASAYILEAASASISRKHYATALEIFLMTNIAFIVAAMLEYIIAVQFPWRSKSKHKTPYAQGEIIEVSF